MPIWLDYEWVTSVGIPVLPVVPAAPVSTWGRQVLLVSLVVHKDVGIIVYLKLKIFQLQQNFVICETVLLK